MLVSKDTVKLGKPEVTPVTPCVVTPLETGVTVVTCGFWGVGCPRLQALRRAAIPKCNMATILGVMRALGREVSVEGSASIPEE
jgi:1-acyl-sn-glycerol-3-phosphate acyltransferase